MSSKRKFAGFLQETQPIEPERSPGKRSNPDWRRHNLFIHKDRYRDVAMIMLAQGDDAPDWSDLIHQLLGEWVDKHSSTRVP